MRTGTNRGLDYINGALETTVDELTSEDGEYAYPFARDLAATLEGPSKLAQIGLVCCQSSRACRRPTTAGRSRSSACLGSTSKRSTALQKLAVAASAPNRQASRLFAKIPISGELLGCACGPTIGSGLAPTSAGVSFAASIRLLPAC